MFEVGDIVRVEKSCLNNPAGSYAVCHEVYRIGEEPGWSFLFPNGLYDGFSESDIQLWNVVLRGHCSDVENYEFRSVLALETDFRNKQFEPAMKLIRTFETED